MTVHTASFRFAIHALLAFWSGKLALWLVLHGGAWILLAVVVGLFALLHIVSGALLIRKDMQLVALLSRSRRHDRCRQVQTPMDAPERR